MPNITLSNQDRRDLLEFLNKYAKKISQADVDEIKSKLEKKLSNLQRKKKLPSFTKKMLEQIKDLTLLMNSPLIKGDKRNKITAALHYFIWAEDKLPDYLPVIGYLDDAFIIATVHRQLIRDIESIKKKPGAEEELYY